MNATGLPILPTAVEPAPKAAAPAAEKRSASADFLLTLVQPADVSAETPLLFQAAALLAEAGAEPQDANALAALPLTIPATLQELGGQQLAASVEALAEHKLDRAVLERAVLERAGGARMMAALPEQKIDTDSAPNANATTLAGTAPVADQSHLLRTAAQADQLGFRPMQTPVGNSAWADELGTRLAWMAERGQHSASLRLSPEHLGPLEVRITIRDDQATVWFGAAHADTRAAIEHALPRLRELFASEGLALADAGVFHEPPHEGTQSQTQASGSAAGDEPSTGAEAALATPQVHLGLLDAYA